MEHHNSPKPKISEVITSLIELQGIIGDQRITLAREETCDVPLPDVSGLGVMIYGDNGEVKRF
jgi:hypothetical protein